MELITAGYQRTEALDDPTPNREEPFFQAD